MRLRVLLFVGISCLLVLVGETMREWAAYEDAVDGVETSLANLATSLAQHADDTLEMADLAVSEIVATLEADGTSPEALGRLPRSIAVTLATSPRLRGLFIYDAQGEWLASSAAPTGVANNSDRAYFQYHRSTDDKGAHLGEAIRSRSGGQWIVTVSRRFDKPDGSFGGVVLASIDAAYFADFYRRFDVGANGSIALFSMAGRVLARLPFDEADIGRDAPGMQPSTLQNSPAGARHYVSSIDRVSRISGYRQAQRYPVIAVAAMARHEALAGWYEAAGWRTVGSIVLTTAIGLLGIRLSRQIGRQQQLEADLARREAEFRLIAEGASDMVSRIGADGRRRYVSPASQRLLGVSPEELVGRSAFDLVDPADMPAIVAAAARLRAGRSVEEIVTFRAQHRDGSRIWLESSLRVAGQGEGIVSVTRDVTERKALEAELSALARTDALTGLTNRRHFEETMLVETGRALRNKAPLSLVLIDLDRFKQFNDTYGHPAGDGCLRTVAARMAAVAKRPGDMAARVGGEELVLLLPATDVAGACHLAERLRDDIERAAIPHAANLPWQVVTASMGVATLPLAANGEATAVAATLMAAADAALYAAKTAGRNRVVPAGTVFPV